MTTTSTNSWILADNGAVLAAAWTAMNQTYDVHQEDVGHPLAWVNDTASLVVVPPWMQYVQPGWTVSAVVEGPWGGKYAIYENATQHEVMLIPMGTNGNSDWKGWAANIRNYGLVQWDSQKTQTDVFSATEAALEAVGGGSGASPKLIIAGDSKGGALSQFVTETLFTQRALKGTKNDLLRNDAILENLDASDIALIGRVAPGSQRADGAVYAAASKIVDDSDLQVFFSAPASTLGDQTTLEIISQTGGDYLDGSNNFHIDSDASVNADSQRGHLNGGHGWFGTRTYLHRLEYSDFEAAGDSQVNGDLATLFTQFATSQDKANISKEAVAALGRELRSPASLPGAPPPPPLTDAQAEAIGESAISSLIDGQFTQLDSVVQGQVDPALLTLQSGGDLASLLLPGVSDALIVASGGQASDLSGPARYAYLAKLINAQEKALQAASGATLDAVTSDVSPEFFTATANETGVTLTGTHKDIIKTQFVDGKTVLTIGGDTLTVKANGSGTPDSLTWVPSNGTTGTELFASDGSSTQTCHYAGGGYATTIDDGQGNITTDYFTKSGSLISSDWVHADGSSGTQALIAGGYTADSQATGLFSVPLLEYNRFVSADGSYEDSSWDETDTCVATPYDTQGKAGLTSTTAGDGKNFDLDTAVTTTTGNGTTDVETVVRTASGQLISDTWRHADGSHGQDTANISGPLQGKTTHFDGSADGYSVFEIPGGPAVSFVLSDNSSLNLSGPLDFTRTHFDSGGLLASDQWTLDDGASGQDSFLADGSGSGQFVHSDGSKSTITLAHTGTITVTNLNASGKASSIDTWSRDGTHSVKMTDAKNARCVYDYAANGTVLVRNYAADGTLVGELQEMAGESFNPDGSSFGKVTESGGGYEIAYNDANGDFALFDYDAGNKLTDIKHLSNGRSSQSEFTGTFSDNTAWSSPYNEKTPVVTDTDGTTRTCYLDETGRESGDDWIATDQSHGTDTFNRDGSSEGSSYKADGSSQYYQDDGHGYLENQAYDASGTETGWAWKDSDGSHGGENFASDGSTTGVSYEADGTYTSSSDDGQGNTIENDYDARGVLVDTEWESADGGYGQADYTADGSSTGTKVAVDGSFVVYDNAISGAVQNQDWSAQGVHLDDRWKDVIGDTGETVFNADGSTTSHANYMDNTSTTGHTDAAGNICTVTYSGSRLISTAASDKNGPKVTTTFASDGSSVTTTLALDGSRSVETEDGKGGSNTVTTAADGTLLAKATSGGGGTSTSTAYFADGRIAQATSITADGIKTVTSDDGAGNTSTAVYDQTGLQTSGSWKKTDGTHGSTMTTAAGLTTTSTYAADGSLSQATVDLVGDKTLAQYDKGGHFMNSSYANVDGSFGNSKVDATGITVTLEKQRDGSYDKISADSTGNVLTVYYTADGTVLRSVTRHADGSTSQNSPTKADPAKDFLKDGVFAHSVVSSTGGTIRLSSRDGTLLEEVEALSADPNVANVGSASPYPGTLRQVTYGANGVQEVITAPWSAVGFLQPLLNELLPDGTDFLSEWDLSEDTSGVTSTTSSPNGGLPAQILAVTPLDGSFAIGTDGGPPMYVYGSGGLAKYGLDGELQPIGVALGSLSQAMRYVSLATSNFGTYADGATFSSTVSSAGWIVHTTYDNPDGSSRVWDGTADDLETDSGKAANGKTYASTGGVMLSDSSQTTMYYADGSVGVSMSGGPIYYPADSETIHDQNGNTVTYQNFADGSQHSSTVDARGDLIATDVSPGRSEGGPVATSSWIESDGTKVTTTVNLRSGLGSERMDYADGAATVLQNDAAGNYTGFDYDASGAVFGDEWGHADGSYGSDATPNAKGMSTTQWVNADGTQGSAVVTAPAAAGLALGGMSQDPVADTAGAGTFGNPWQAVFLAIKHERQDADIGKLVDAMAAFDPPASAQMTHTMDERPTLHPLLAAHWR